MKFQNSPGFSSTGDRTKKVRLSGLKVYGVASRRRELQATKPLFSFDDFSSFTFVDSDISTQLPLLRVRNVDEADVEDISVQNSATCFVFNAISSILRFYNVTLDNVQGGGANPVV